VGRVLCCHLLYDFLHTFKSQSKHAHFHGLGLESIPQKWLLSMAGYGVTRAITASHALCKTAICKPHLHKVHLHYVCESGTPQVHTKGAVPAAREQDARCRALVSRPVLLQGCEKLSCPTTVPKCRKVGPGQCLRAIAKRRSGSTMHAVLSSTCSAIIPVLTIPLLQPHPCRPHQTQHS